MNVNPQDSPFENDARMLRKGVDELCATVQDYASSEKFKELLNFTAQFKKYAPYNAILNEVGIDEILKATRLAEQVLNGWPLEGCYLYAKSAEFKKATDEYRAWLKKKKDSATQQEFGGFNG